MKKDVLPLVVGAVAFAWALSSLPGNTEAPPSNFPPLPPLPRAQYRVSPETTDIVGTARVGDQLALSKVFAYAPGGGDFAVVYGAGVLVPTANPYLYEGGTKPGQAIVTFRGADGVTRTQTVVFA